MAMSDNRFCFVRHKNMAPVEKVFLECLFDEIAANDAYHISRAMEKVRDEKKKALYYIMLFPLFLPFNFLMNGMKGIRTQIYNSKKCYKYLKTDVKQHIKEVYRELV